MSGCNNKEAITHSFIEEGQKETASAQRLTSLEEGWGLGPVDPVVDAFQCVWLQQLKSQRIRRFRRDIREEQRLD